MRVLSDFLLQERFVHGHLVLIREGMDLSGVDVVRGAAEQRREQETGKLPASLDHLHGVTTGFHLK